MSDLQANSVYWWEVAEEAKAELARLRAELAARDAECARLREALVGITSNPYITLGNLAYDVREREGKGWDGPAVKTWCEAVKSVNEALAASKPKEPKS